jgi:[CysO sulfur-carrier protein]-S-L-cysteine hydrolase
MLELPQSVVDQVIALAVEEYPYESCGLLAGPPGGAVVTRFYRCRNAAESARVYTVDPSHTHTAAFPSPTDVAQAPDPAWHYAIVSLQQDQPSLRSYRIVGDTVTEEPITIS